MSSVTIVTEMNNARIAPPKIPVCMLD